MRNSDQYTCLPILHLEVTLSQSISGVSIPL